MVYLFIIDVHASIIYGGEMDDGDIPQSLSIPLTDSFTNYHMHQYNHYLPLTHNTCVQLSGEQYQWCLIYYLNQDFAWLDGLHFVCHEKISE